MGRLDVKIHDSMHDWQFKDFSLVCPFFVPLIGWYFFAFIALYSLTFLVINCLVVRVLLKWNGDCSATQTGICT